MARYKLAVGLRIGSATLIADARHSWLDALSSAGALAGSSQPASASPGRRAGGAAFIRPADYQVTANVARRLADGVDPVVITTAEADAGSVPGVIHAHARWTGPDAPGRDRSLVDPDLPVRDADALGGQVAAALARQLPRRAA